MGRWPGVARLIEKDNEPFDREELGFLKSFAGLVERLCKDQYDRKTQVVRSRA
jgi:hypothetical protein